MKVLIISNGPIVRVHTKRKLDTNTMAYLKMEKFLKGQLYFLVELNMLENLKISNLTDLEILLGQMEINILVNGNLEKVMEVEQKYGAMEESIQERLKMTNCMEKEFFIIQMAKNM